MLPPRACAVKEWARGGLGNRGLPAGGLASGGETGRLGAGFAAVDAGFGAPFGGQAAYGLIDGIVKAEEVADYLAVEEGAVGVGIGQVGRHQLTVAEVVEDGLGGVQPVIGEGAQVKDRQCCGVVDS